MKLPTPAELATFAQAIGWTGKGKMSFGLDQKRMLMHFWRQWEEDIQQVHAEIESMNTPPKSYTIKDVMAKLGSQNADTLKSWFVTGFISACGPLGIDQAEAARMWHEMREKNDFGDVHIEMMERERDRRLSARGSAGGRGRAVKKTKQKT